MWVSFFADELVAHALSSYRARARVRGWRVAAWSRGTVYGHKPLAAKESDCSESDWSTSAQDKSSRIRKIRGFTGISVRE